MRFAGVFLPLLMLSLLPCAVATKTQTSAQFAAKYPKIVSYEVRPGIVLTPRYAADGKVCEVFLQERYTAAGDTKDEYVLSRETVKGLVDELTPPAVRGRRASGIAEKWLNTEVSGTSITTSYQYENVIVRVYGSTANENAALVTITWRKRTCSPPWQPSTNALRPKRK